MHMGQNKIYEARKTPRKDTYIYITLYFHLFVEVVEEKKLWHVRGNENVKANYEGRGIRGKGCGIVTMIS